MIQKKAIKHKLLNHFRILTFLFLICNCIACGYTLEGNNPPLPQNAKSIGIAPVENQTLQTQLDIYLLSNLRQKLRNNESVRVVPKRNAHLSLKVILNHFSTSQVSTSSQNTSGQRSMLLKGKVTLIDERTNELLWTASISATSPLFFIQSESELGISDFNLEQSLKRLTKEFSQQIYEKIFLDF